MVEAGQPGAGQPGAGQARRERDRARDDADDRAGRCGPQRRGTTRTTGRDDADNRTRDDGGAAVPAAERSRTERGRCARLR